MVRRLSIQTVPPLKTATVRYRNLLSPVHQMRLKIWRQRWSKAVAPKTTCHRASGCTLRFWERLFLEQALHLLVHQFQLRRKEGLTIGQLSRRARCTPSLMTILWCLEIMSPQEGFTSQQSIQPHAGRQLRSPLQPRLQNHRPNP